jgi:hypothetical protein
MYSLAGRPAEAISNANRALRLSPFDTAIFQAHKSVGMAAVQQGRHADGASHFAKATLHLT